MEIETRSNQQLATILLKREAHWSYSLRSFRVYIDEHEVRRIANDKTEPYHVLAGLHSVQIKIDFYSSNLLQINVLPGETLSLCCTIQSWLQGPYLEFCSPLSASLISPPSKAAQKNFQNPNLQVVLDPKLEPISVVTEDIQVPLGVIIKVTRSRTFEHTLDLNWNDELGGQFEVGLKDLISASIQKKIERQQGRGYKESETVSYEIELNGTTAAKYQLIWTDIWQQGTVQFPENKGSVIPFRFRERAELEVRAVK
ncbi:hypothetical protein [Nostoc sp.]